MPVFDEGKRLLDFLDLNPPVRFKTPGRILMTDPTHYDIRYAINPHMRSATGELQKIDRALAHQQWNELLAVYREWGTEVEIVAGDPNLPDMVFAANHGFTWQRAQDKKPQILMSRMRSKLREPEIPLFESWYRKSGYDVHHLISEGSFEGNGDALSVHSLGIGIGGIGPRTDEWIYDEISERFALPILRISLVDDRFYHLDTCLSILNENTVALCPKAFDKTGQDALYALFDNVIEVSDANAIRYFSCNSHCPDAKHVITQPGDTVFHRSLETLNFKVVEINTSEFIKAGGSVYCLKMAVY